MEKISVTEIIKKAGYNRSTFYQYFSDIYELLDYVENDVLNYVKHKLPEEIKWNMDNSTSYSSMLYKEKGLYLEALLGDYGSDRFFEQLKNSINPREYFFNLPENDPLIPYLSEYNRTMSLSLFRLWRIKALANRLVY